VAEYVKSCIPYQQMKVYPEKAHGLLNPIPLPSAPWEQATVDFITQLPPSQGYDVILVVTDQFSKRVHFMATTSNISAEGNAQLFHDNVWKHHGWMQKIITDQGTQFAVKFTQALNDLLGVEMALSTTYHPQMDGQTERINQELEQYLQLYTNFMQSDWVEWLSSAEFAYNNHPHSATGQSPFFLKYGRHPNLPTMVHASGIENPTAEEFVESLGQAWDVAGSALLHTAETMKRFTDRKRKVPRFAPGELVWLDLRNISTSCPSKNLDAHCTGPFEVIEGVPRDTSTH
jgi:hypothetical protein